jgi:hypothetical protein
LVAISLVPDPPTTTRSLAPSALAVSVLLLGGWIAWLAHQPPCGPPGNTELAHVDRWMPFAFIAGEFVGITALGALLKRPLLSIAVAIATVGTLSILCGALIAFLIAARGGCFS